MSRSRSIGGRLVCAAVMLFAVSLCAQHYPDTIWVRVIFYDFHSDMSCPEFQMDNNYSVEQNMVRSDVVEYDTENADYWGRDSILKPVYSTQNIRHNRYIKYWYRPWATNAKGDYTIPNYTGPAGRLGTPEIIEVDHDTSFKNVVIRDSLPFIHTGGGMYQFSRTGSGGESEFFWIDGRGFGNESTDGDGNPRNFSFAMELHWTFTYEPGLEFEFNGDDDVWVFINGELAMDLGGVHGPTPASFDVDDIAGDLNLERGREYSFDLFYAERHTVQSTIRITTNIIGPPSTLRLYPKPGAPNTATNRPYPPLTIVNAGETIPVYAHVFDSAGQWRPEYDSLVEWSLVDTLGNPGLSTQRGAGTTLTPTEAYGHVTIVATFANPDFPDQVERATLSVYVRPGDPHHLDIQRDSTITSRRDDDSFTSLTLQESQYSAPVYAVVRDQYGNYIRHARYAAWRSTDTLVATVAGGAVKWMATVSKNGAGQTAVIASETGLVPDTLSVQTYMPGTNLSSAVTRDLDGDGYLDAVELRFDSLSVRPSLSDLEIRHGNYVFTLKDIEGASGATGNVFVVTLEEHTRGELQTGWTLEVSGEAPGVVPWHNKETVDGAGPVIKGAVHYPGNAGTADTLRVSFSEKVNCDALKAMDPERAFRYFKDGVEDGQALRNARYASSACGDEAFIDGVTILTSGTDFVFTPFEDSLQLVDGARDGADNPPPSDGRKAPLQIAGENNIVISASPNPFVPGFSLIPPVTREYYRDVAQGKQRGTIIGIGTKKPLKCRENCDSDRAGYGKAAIYDAVGNLVADNLRVGRANPDTQRDYGILWSGANRNGRFVGSGGYLVVIEGEDIDGEALNKTLKVGVKR